MDWPAIHFLCLHVDLLRGSDTVTALMRRITCTARSIAEHLIFSSLCFSVSVKLSYPSMLAVQCDFLLRPILHIFGALFFSHVRGIQHKTGPSAIHMYSQGAAAALFGLSPQSYAYGTNLDFCRFVIMCDVWPSRHISAWTTSHAIRTPRHTYVAPANPLSTNEINNEQTPTNLSISQV